KPEADSATSGSGRKGSTRGGCRAGYAAGRYNHSSPTGRGHASTAGPDGFHPFEPRTFPPNLDDSSNRAVRARPSVAARTPAFPFALMTRMRAKRIAKIMSRTRRAIFHQLHGRSPATRPVRPLTRT